MVEILSVTGKFDAHRIRTVVCFLLGNSPASEFYMSTFRNPVCSMLEHLYGKRFGSSQTFSRINTPAFST
jgi:hypothetical protein